MDTHGRAGVTWIEAVVVIGVIGLLMALATPWILSNRESARLTRCRNNLRQLGLALHAYHDTYGTLPPAAIWKPGPFDSLALRATDRIDLITHENWAILLLPFLGREDLARQFVPNQPIAADVNAAARTTRPSTMICPSDNYNRPDNPYVFRPIPGREIRFARGNYAINGGTACASIGPGNTAFLGGDHSHLEIDQEERVFRLWGNGVAGFNVYFSLDDFTNDLSTLVALEEIRAGVHAIDPRGCWAWGQIGGSITWGHGVNVDDYGPNNPWKKADDIMGCGKLHEVVGSEFLQRVGMPCCWYCKNNLQATSRSRHPGGVNVLFLDGAVRFISNDIDPGLWHVIHSRETPPEVLADNFEERLTTTTNITREADYLDRTLPVPDAEPFSTLTNSLGMEFLLLPAGEYTMGVPDENVAKRPPKVPAHKVRITRPFYMGKFEVTRKQYARVMEMELDGDKPPDFPIGNVTWNQAQEFCRRLSELPAEQAAGRRYRLPTEAEWEYACRSGSSERYEWTPRRAPDDDSGEAAGILPPLPITPVGSYPPNDFGLYDMRGNVWEWCADWFDRDYYVRSPLEDPQGPAAGYIKVVRGGDWRFIGEVCPLDSAMLPPWKKNPFIGFRVVCVIEGKPKEASPGSERQEPARPRQAPRP